MRDRKQKLPLFDDFFHSVRNFAKATLQANTKIHITVSLLTIAV